MHSSAISHSDLAICDSLAHGVRKSICAVWGSSIERARGKRRVVGKSKIFQDTDFIWNYSEWSHVNTLIFGNMAIVKRLYLVTSANRIAMELRTTFTTSRILKVLSSEKKVALLGMLVSNLGNHTFLENCWQFFFVSSQDMFRIVTTFIYIYLFIILYIYAHYILTLPIYNHYWKEQLWPGSKRCSPVTFQDTERSNPSNLSQIFLLSPELHLTLGVASAVAGTGWHRWDRTIVTIAC